MLSEGEAARSILFGSALTADNDACSNHYLHYSRALLT